MLTHRFDDALAFAVSAHRAQQRKGCDIPYFSHLMAVSALAFEYGGDEDCAIAALLHDAVEDQGGLEMADRIEDQFGPRIRRIVLECSDRENDADTDWKTRKLRYLATIENKSDDAILVTSCDKLHNATTILYDFINEGPAVFERFTARKEGTLWYYGALSNALSARNPGALSNRLADTVEHMHAVANR